MILQTDPRKGPLYIQIADRLRQDIRALDRGARIPSEPKLARDWGVSRFTIQRAVEQLVEEGLITRRQGSGSFVAEAPLRRAPGYLLSFTEAVEAAGRSPSHKLLAYKTAPWEDGLPYPEEAELLLLDRLRLVDGAAVARHRSLLSAELAAATGLTRKIASASDFSLYRFLEGRGLSVTSGTERLIARGATEEERALLDLARDAVVVAVTRHSFAADGAALDAVSATYDARRYSYEARLVRDMPGLLSNQEKRYEDDTFDRRGHTGARLGPWGN